MYGQLFLATAETRMEYGFFVAEATSEISPAQRAGWVVANGNVLKGRRIHSSM
jgi:hypothetical protein